MPQHEYSNNVLAVPVKAPARWPSECRSPDRGMRTPSQVRGILTYGIRRADGARAAAASGEYRVRLPFLTAISIALQAAILRLRTLIYRPPFAYSGTSTYPECGATERGGSAPCSADPPVLGCSRRTETWRLVAYGGLSGTREADSGTWRRAAHRYCHIFVSCDSDSRVYRYDRTRLYHSHSSVATLLGLTPSPQQ